MKEIFLALLIALSFAEIQAEVSLNVLSEQTLERFKLVTEFAFIQEQANELGVKVYLFGGTASAFAHYVRWDLEREAGDKKYQKERFDYDFTNIYRGNQDLDIVVDGTAEQAAQLEQILKEQYPHFVGSKDAWEVRLLQTQINDKLPLLNNYDFLNQHTDTNSTGMLTINPDEGGIVFRDLFSWEDSESQFLKDVANGEIKFLFSKKHKKTSRFKEAKNPPIFAAVRYLAKLAQYEVKGTEADLGLIKKIVNEEKWEEIKNNSYVKHKLEEFGKKVLLNAPDSEYAWNLLESVGLREKLIEMDGDRTNVLDTLSWWMNKEPLRSKEIGLGKGKTAREIFKENLNSEGELVLAHETNSFLAYENITRSSKGKANAFISRRGVDGEAALLGNGFYTKIGTKGARGTNLTIRFKLNPDAKEGTDFIYNGEYIVISNKNVLTLIQENLNISLLDFFKLFSSNEIDISDKGFVEKLKRKFYRAGSSNREELAEAKAFLDAQNLISKDFPFQGKDVLELNDTNFDSLLETFLKQREALILEIKNSIIKDEHFWLNNFKFVEIIAEKNILRYMIIDFILKKASLDDFSKLTKTIEILIESEHDHIHLIERIFTKQEWVEHPKTLGFLKKILNNHQKVEEVLKAFFWNSGPYAVRSSTGIELLDYVLTMGGYEGFIAEEILSKEAWAGHPGIEPIIYKLIKLTNESVMFVLSEPHWANHPKAFEFLKAVIGQYKNDSYTKSLTDYYLQESREWMSNPGLLAVLDGDAFDINLIHERILDEFFNDSNTIGLCREALE